MKYFILAGLLATIVNCQGIGQPSFTWLNDNPHPIPVLKITFPDGSEDIAIMKQYNPIPVQRDEREEDVDNCIYDGYLAHEKDVYVTVTGCANTKTFNIQFRSQRLADSMFKVIDGAVESVQSIFGSHIEDRDGNLVMVTDKAVAVEEETRRNRMGLTTRALNPKGYNLNIKARYDENFKAKFGADSVNVVRRVLAQAQNIWRLPSLTSSATFIIDSAVDAVAGRFVADTDIEKASVYSTDKTNVNLVMAFRNNQPGTVGIAYTGTVCASAKYRTALCEYFVDDLKAGQVVAHEIGHNMGMGHDFDKQPGAMRKDSKGKPCSGVGGVMDYYGTVDKWSSCSVEDFTALVNSKSPFCLTAL